MNWIPADLTPNLHPVAIRASGLMAALKADAASLTSFDQGCEGLTGGSAAALVCFLLLQIMGLDKSKPHEVQPPPRSWMKGIGFFPARNRQELTKRSPDWHKRFHVAQWPPCKLSGGKGRYVKFNSILNLNGD